MNGRPILGQELLPLRFQQSRPRARQQFDPDPAPHRDQPIVLKLLIRLCHRQGICALLRRERTNLRKQFTLFKAAGQDRGDNLVAQFKIDGTRLVNSCVAGHGVIVA